MQATAAHSKKEHRHQKPVRGNWFQLPESHVIQSANNLPQSAAQPPLLSATFQSCSTYGASGWTARIPTYVPKGYRLFRRVTPYGQDRVHFHCTGNELLKVRRLLGNTNHRDTLTTWASPPTYCFVLLTGFPLFHTARRIAIFGLITYNYYSQSYKDRKYIFHIYHAGLDASPFLFSFTKLSVVWCNRSETHNTTCNKQFEQEKTSHFGNKLSAKVIFSPHATLPFKRNHWKRIFFVRSVPPALKTEVSASWWHLTFYECFSTSTDHE